MLDLIKKGMLTGIGLALKTWDEVEEFAKELEKKGKMTEQEGKRMLDELRHKYEDTQEKLEGKVESVVKNFLKKADIVTGDELKGLKKEIRELKKIISDQGAKDL
ncbi:MAG: hypothetical protein HKM93_05440 [Desulfobacteraceae bacterium]|nr:hypothetical protein [Desulfobacteraceae bacterium]